MTCERVRQWLPEWLDGEMEPAAGYALEAHLTACEACRREWQAQRRLLFLIADVPRRWLSPEWDARLAERLAALERGKGSAGRCGTVLPLRAFRPWAWLLGPVAGLSAAVLALAVWLAWPERGLTPVRPADRAYLARLVRAHAESSPSREATEVAVDAALSATSLGGLIE